jgi:hypothetical protein
MFMLALVITIIIVDTLFHPHLTIMSSTIYMYISVHKKNPVKTYSVYTHFSGGKSQGQEGRNIKRRIEDGGRMVKR